MSGPTVVTVVGNRPQYIKCAVVSRLLRERVREVLVDTGQHYDHGLAGVFFEQLHIPRPDVSLGVGSGSHAEQTARSLIGVERAITERDPQLVLVYGDTNATLAGALAAAKLGVPVAHVEAGLRSYDRSMPEEVNRVLTDHLAELLFCPTEAAVSNLGREGITEGVALVGDVMNDLALTSLTPALEAAALTRLGLQRGRFVYATIHRPVNADSPLRLAAIFGALSSLDEPVLVALHPRTRVTLQQEGLDRGLGDNVTLVDPVGYFDSLALAGNARAVVTDSGGVQKEAYVLGTPCITLRDRTEWVETVESGWNVLVDADRRALAAALDAPPPAGDRPLFYGDGHAGARIVATIAAFLGA
jgi:UDP-N-acetylglucosamine 2-epimerase